jgi:diketogulonate reductase-like aldo/keto reductase
VVREELFLQTKFTFRGGQDHRLPYDPRASVAAQVAQSFASSLDHLGVQWLDSFLLHGPSQRVGLGADDWEAWRAMEQLHDRGAVRRLGVSNVSLRQLEEFSAKSRIRPAFVQNRCYASTGWDREVRRFCGANQIIYQGFSLLTANQAVLVHSKVLELARTHGRTPSQIVFRFALEVGMLPLTGTTSAEHMREDLETVNFRLSPREVELIETLAVR